MDNIIEPNETFDFSKLSLALPTGIQGGAYFTKINYLNKPLYIQTSKSQTKQGIVKNGKKIHCDLMFDNNSENLIRWFERLETKCQQLIYEKSEAWFQSTLALNDIETAFNSIIRVYKSGKYYLVRTNVKNNTTTNLPIIKIYNENENMLSIEDVTSESNVISIIEIQGIKFTTHNFQVEMELKQVMVLNNEPLFESCLIKTPFKKTEFKPEVINDDYLEETIKDEIDNCKTNDVYVDLNDVELNNGHLNSVEFNNADLNNVELDNVEFNKADLNSVEFNNAELDNVELDNVDLNIEDLNEKEENQKELKEIDFDISLENNLETMKLKKPNDVYYDLYKQARNKAKEAKKIAIVAYLEAKNIKKTYMLDELDYSDNDIDNEIEEVSESELEGL
jgi:uncharacterized protein YjbI with pentapeptide repeats